MKQYDGNRKEMGIHYINVTLQDGEDIGSFLIKIFGNCHGREILNSFSFADFPFLSFNSETLTISRLQEKEDKYFITFASAKEEKICTAADLNNMIIGLDIVEYKPTDIAPFYVPEMFSQEPDKKLDTWLFRWKKIISSIRNAL